MHTPKIPISKTGSGIVFLRKYFNKPYDSNFLTSKYREKKLSFAEVLNKAQTTDQVQLYLTSPAETMTHTK